MKNKNTKITHIVESLISEKMNECSVKSACIAKIYIIQRPKPWVKLKVKDKYWTYLMIL